MAENLLMSHMLNNTDYYLNVYISYSNNYLHYHSFIVCKRLKNSYKKNQFFWWLPDRNKVSQNYFINNFVIIVPDITSKLTFLLMKIIRAYILKRP
jgi:hypothetical protein